MLVKELIKELKRQPLDAVVVVVPTNPGTKCDGYELVENVDYDEPSDVVEVWFTTHRFGAPAQ